MSEIDATKIEFHLRSRLRQRRRVRRKSGIVELAEAGDRAPGVPSPSAHLQRCSEKEALSGQSMRRSGVSRDSQKPVPATLHDMVGTADDRASRSDIPPQCDPNYHGDRIADLQGARTPSEGGRGPCEQAHLHRGFENSTRVAEVHLTDIAVEAFRSQIEIAGPGPWLFRSSKNPIGYQTNFNTFSGLRTGQRDGQGTQLLDS